MIESFFRLRARSAGHLLRLSFVLALLLPGILLAQAPATSALPPGWFSVDIGLPPVAGSEQMDAGVLSVSGGGAGIGDLADQFHYVYAQVTGDVDLMARVNAVELINEGTAAGVMIRESLTPNAAHA